MDVEAPFREVAIVGLGLMGGSLARALTASRARVRVRGWSPDDEEREAASAAGVVEEAPARLEEALDGAELVVYAAPLEATRELIRRGTLPHGAIGTDVCSLKAPILQAAAAAGVAERFVGGHPMAGSHRSGWRPSRPDLYRGARVWLVPANASDDERQQAGATGRIAALWRSIGAEPRTIGAAEHDRLMAWASHLPQLGSWALARALREHGVAEDRLGPGGRDATRLAESPVGLWLELLGWNREADLLALDALWRSIEAIREALAGGDEPALERLLEEARSWKRGP